MRGRPQHDGLGRRALAAATLLVSFVALIAPAWADPDERLDEIERRRARLGAALERVEGKESEVSAKVRALDDDRAAAQAKLESADAQLALLDGRIGEVERRLTQAQKELAALSEELKGIERRLAQRTDVFAARAVAAYKAGPAAYVDSMLSSESLSELIDRYAYYESALRTDSELLGQIELLHAEVETRRDLVEDKEEQIAAAKLQLEEDRRIASQVRAERADALAVVQESLDQKESLLVGLRASEARLEAIDRQLEQESSQIAALLAARAAAAAAAAAPSEPAAPSTGPVQAGNGQFVWPTAGPVTSGYGYRVHPIFGTRRMHTGIDISAPYGQTVVSGDGGTVAYVGVMSGYGNVVVVDHGDGLATTYNHLSGFSVSSGQSVGRGQPVGSVGCSGYCTGPHLHFEVRVNGSPVDPMPYLQ